MRLNVSILTDENINILKEKSIKENAELVVMTIDFAMIKEQKDLLLFF